MRNQRFFFSSQNVAFFKQAKCSFLPLTRKKQRKPLFTIFSFKTTSFVSNLGKPSLTHKCNTEVQAIKQSFYLLVHLLGSALRHKSCNVVCSEVKCRRHTFDVEYYVLHVVFYDFFVNNELQVIIVILTETLSSSLKTTPGAKVLSDYSTCPLSNSSKVLCNLLHNFFIPSQMYSICFVCTVTFFAQLYHITSLLSCSIYKSFFGSKIKFFKLLQYHS